MKRTKPIRDGLLALNFQKVAHELSKHPITFETGADLLQLARQLGIFLVQFPNPQRATLRESFLADFRVWADANGLNELRLAIDDHERQALICEGVFHLILQNLECCPTGSCPPQVALWSVLSGIAKDANAVAMAALAVQAEPIGSNTVYMSAESLRVEVFGRPGLDSDAVAERYADDLAGYLKMNAHKHGLFQDGVLVLPRPISIPEDIANDRSPIYLAEVWNQLDGHWGKVRYFASSDVQICEPAVDGAPRVLSFTHDHDFLLDVEVARGRLRRQAFEIMMHVLYAPETKTRTGDPRNEPLPLAPSRFLSTHEAFAMMVLDICYELNLRSEKNPYLGLSIAQWLRGYALLQWCAETGTALIQHSPGLSRIDQIEFARLAEQVGLPSSASSSFLELTTFGAKSRDLWDTPLLRDEVGELYLITSFMKTCNLSEALISRLNALLQQIRSKGPKFEAEVREEFQILGAHTKQFRYRVGSDIFECDAAALWSQVLFLSECKAYVLPQPTAEDLYFFREKQREAVEQVKRIGQHLSNDPNILKKHFPEAVDAEQVVLCVINQAPFWSQAYDPDVRFFDGRALSKFISGSVDAVVRSPEAPTSAPVARGVLHSLWSGTLPTPADLQKQMAGPFQHCAEKSLWRLVERDISFTDKLILRFPWLQRMPDPPIAS